MRELAQAYAGLFRFFFGQGWALLGEVQRALAASREANPDGASGARFWSFDRKVIERYNREYERLRAELKPIVPRRGSQFGRRILFPHVVVWLVAVGATLVSPGWGFLVLGLQLLVTPYAAFAATAFLAFVAVSYLFQAVLFVALQSVSHVAIGLIPGLDPFLRVPLTLPLLLGFLVADQLASSWIQRTRAAPVPLGMLARSVVYGFYNTKGMWLLFLLALRGFRLDLFAIAVTVAFPGFCQRLLQLPGRLLPARLADPAAYGVLFYHYHRTVHLPGPYEAAHRHHHALHDTTAFDADLYGSGQPEKIFAFLLQVPFSLATGLVPPALSGLSLRPSLANKIGHTRRAEPHLNFHADHHVRHVRNFGTVSLPLDLLTGTAEGDVSGLGTDPPLYRCRRSEAEEFIVLTIERAE